MKKTTIQVILTIILTMSLFGCTQSNDSPEDTTPKTDKDDHPVSSLQYVKGFSNSFSNDAGYYYTRTNREDDAQGNPYMNIMYIDYESKKEVYLCNKSNCAHNDESCPSYLNSFGTLGLFIDADKLYQFTKVNSSSTEGASLGSSSFVPTVYVSELDGSNRKKLATLPSGTEFSESFVFGNGLVFMGIEKHELVSNSDGTMTDTVVENNLVAIDLSNGNYKELVNLDKRKMIAAYDQKILFNEIEYTSTEGTFSDQLNSAKLSFSSYNSNTGKLEEVIKIAYPESYVSDKNKVYYIDNHDKTMQSIDLENGTTTTLLDELPSIPNILYTYANHVICITSDQNGTSDFYAINTTDKTLSNINLFLSNSNPSNEIAILAELENQFLVRTGYITNSEYVPWAGVSQESIVSETFALIDKQDYFSGQGNYREILHANK